MKDFEGLSFGEKTENSKHKYRLQSTIECRFTLKRVRDMIITFSGHKL